MTQEQNELIFKDLLGRLPYGVVMVTPGGVTYTLNFEILKNLAITINGFAEDKPYLRPMSSMTEEEEEKLSEEIHKDFLLAREAAIENNLKKSTSGFNKLDWLNSHHFDYRGLIPMGLALEAPEGMYKTK